MLIKPSRLALHTVLISLLTAGLSACSDPMAASKANFANAVTPVLATQCAYVNVPRFDRATHEAGSETYLFGDWFPFRLSDGQGLMAAGLLKPAPLSNTRQGLNVKQVIAVTPEGKKDLRRVGDTHVLCVADIALKEVKSWTQPADSFGRRVSQVTVVVGLTNHRPWASNPTLREQIQGIAAFDADTREITLPAVLTNDGWKFDGVNPVVAD